MFLLEMVEIPTLKLVRNLTLYVSLKMILPRSLPASLSLSLSLSLNRKILFFLFAVIDTTSMAAKTVDEGGKSNLD